MTAPIVYTDTRNPYTPLIVPPYMCDGDRRLLKRYVWGVPAGQLWERVAEVSS